MMFESFVGCVHHQLFKWYYVVYVHTHDMGIANVARLPAQIT